MRLSTSIAIVLGVNFLALLGLAGWLQASDRLSRQRLHQVREIFAPTLEEAAQELRQAEELEAQARAQQAELARWEEVADGPQRFTQKLGQQFQAEELALEKIERLQRDVRDLARRLETDKQRLLDQKAELEQARDAFEEAVRQRLEKFEDEDFKAALQMVQSQRPEQVKAMFQALMAQDQTDEVVDYLAAMQARKAAAVLKAFETPEEIIQAAMLIEALRTRGSNLAPDLLDREGGM